MAAMAIHSLTGDLKIAEKRRIAAILRDTGRPVNDKRVERLWRQDGLKQTKRGQLWFNDGSCMRLKPEHKNHVLLAGSRSYDFVPHRTDDGRAYRTLNILDEFSRECSEIRAKRKLNSTDVVDALTDLFNLGAGLRYSRRERP